MNKCKNDHDDILEYDLQDCYTRKSDGTIYIYECNECNEIIYEADEEI